jgi:hypothetical protein
MRNVTYMREIHVRAPFNRRWRMKMECPSAPEIDVDSLTISVLCRYCVKHVGGSSVSPIDSAAITAEAEYGNRKGDQSIYNPLAAIPKEWGASNLHLRLFQHSTPAGHFRVRQTAMRAKSVFGQTKSVSDGLKRILYRRPSPQWAVQ